MSVVPTTSSSNANEQVTTSATETKNEGITEEHQSICESSKAENENDQKDEFPQQRTETNNSTEVVNNDGEETPGIDGWESPRQVGAFLLRHQFCI